MKGALEVLSRHLALELGPRRIADDLGPVIPRCCPTTTAGSLASAPT